MPIKWSALKVREATDEIETYIEQVREPVASIKSAAELALEIPSIPEYIQQGFRSLSDGCGSRDPCLKILRQQRRRAKS